MNITQPAVGFRISIAVVVLWIVAFSMACRLSGMGSGEEYNSALSMLLGSSRTEFSSQFFQEADRYFHKGVGHYRKKFFTDWFVNLGNDIKPGGHIHLHDEGVKEIMPWLYFSTRMDPHNVTAYAVAAFWLASEVKRPDLAENLLLEAQRNNPRDYRVYLEKGRLALKQDREVAAANAFDTAIMLWPGPQNPDDVETKMDKAQALSFRGLLYEIEGDISQALAMYNDVLTIFPGREGLRKRVIELETCGHASVSPFDLWKIMLFHHPHVCSRQED